MKGLYILSSPHLNDNNSFKFGMSSRLHERWFDYSDHFTDTYYEYLFTIKDISIQNIKFLEQEILKQTNKYIKKGLGNEFRDTTQISIETFKFIIIETLNYYKVDYELQIKPVFDKPKRKEYEQTDLIIPEEIFIREQDLIPSEPSSPVIEPDIITLRDEVQQLSHQVFVDKLNEYEYFQGIYNIATGIGKTFIAYSNCIYHLNKYPEDNILWITYKNEIVESQDTNILGDKLIKFNQSVSVDTINNQSGKVIVILRQKLQNIYSKLKPNLIQGIIYDECHDACKVSIEKTKLIKNKIEKNTEGKTFDILIYLENKHKLKYRNGYSATPLTSSKKQNAGLLQLYGCKITNKINYLYTCSLVDGVDKKLILKPNIEFIPISNIDLLNELNFKSLESHKLLIDDILKIIEEIITNDKFYYKKFIFWFPTIEISEYFYNIFNNPNFTKFVSNSKSKNLDETNFKKIEKNAIMFACDKFTTGFNGRNLECGINFRTNEEGHKIAQKLGRFTRLKLLQNTAYLYQVIDKKNEEDKFINNIIKCLEGLGVNLNEINRYVRVKDMIGNQKSNQSKIELNLEKFNLTIDILQNIIDFKFSSENVTNKIKRLIKKYNDNLLNKNNLIDLIHNNNFIYSKSKIIEFIKTNRLLKYVNELNIDENIFQFSFSQKLYNNIKQMLYSEVDFVKLCENNNINSENYKEMTKKYTKMPNWEMIDLGYYNGRTFSVILNNSIVDLDGF